MSRIGNAYMYGLFDHTLLLLGPAHPSLQEPDPIAFSAITVSIVSGVPFYGLPLNHDFIRRVAIFAVRDVPIGIAMSKIVQRQVL